MVSKTFKSTVVCFVLCAAAHSALAQVGTPQDARDSAVPKSETLTWDDERDLYILLDDATNRVLVLNNIYAACLNINAPITDAARLDGFKVCGHGYYTEQMYAESRAAFEHMIAIAGVTPQDQGAAWRMIAQSYYNEANIADAHQAFATAYGIESVLYDAGDLNGLAGVIQMYAYSASRVGNITEALDALDETVARFEISTNGYEQLHLPQLIELSARYASEHGLEAEAETYLADLLANFPLYGLSDSPLQNIRLQLEQQYLELQGHDLFECDAVAVERIWELYKSVDYAHVPLKYSLADQIAACMAQKGEHAGAISLRMLLLQDTGDALAAITDPVLVNYIELNRGSVLMSHAKHLDALKRDDEAVEVYEEVAETMQGIDPRLVQRAQDRANQLIQ